MSRGVKNKSEIEKHKKACDITDRIFSEVVKNFKFKTETELRDFIASRMKFYKVKKSFPTIIGGGSNASEIHHKPIDRRLSSFVVIDFGVIYKKQMSDMTRTVYVGKPSKKEITLYKKILKTEVDSIKNVFPGKSCRDLDLESRKMLGSHSKYFIHALGHGVGKRIHEFPKIMPRSKNYLKENMIITIEPGVYEEGKYGIRIEDTILVTKKGPEVLTKSPKKLFIF